MTDAALTQAMDNLTFEAPVCPFRPPQANGNEEAHLSTPSNSREPRQPNDTGPTQPLPAPPSNLDTDLNGVTDSDTDAETATIHPRSSCPVITTQEIDPELLKKSLSHRIAYITDFLNFTEEDAWAITDAAPLVNTVIPTMVDGMYEKLFEFDITKKVFMKRNEGFDGELPKRLEDLTLDSPQISFRKIFMKSWARRVLTADYTSDKTWAYMNKVGLMHTGVSPFKHQQALGIPPLNVPYRDCALMLGWVQQVLQSSILAVPDEKLSMPKKLAAVSAINKVIWIQNDLFSRHYIDE